MEYDIEDQPPPYTYTQNTYDKKFFIEFYTFIFIIITILLALSNIYKLLCLYIYVLLQMLFFICFRFLI